MKNSRHRPPERRRLSPWPHCAAPVTMPTLFSSRAMNSLRSLPGLRGMRRHNLRDNVFFRQAHGMRHCLTAQLLEPLRAARLLLAPFFDKGAFFDVLEQELSRQRSHLIANELWTP